MSKFVEYQKLKSEIDSLSKKLSVMEGDGAIKKESTMLKAIDGIIEKNGMSREQVVAAWLASDHSLKKRIESSIGSDAASGSAKSTRSRSRRAMTTYTNPETNESVTTRGGNHKTLNEWRKTHGKSVVSSWGVKG